MMARQLLDMLDTIWNLVITSPTPSMSVIVLMVSVLLSGFLIRLIVRRHRIRTARADIPFVIGGWGTRGKSGTERKKAALFEGLGYNVTGKTTGCEAMIIHARPGQDAVELPIYRPNDKATIWEQGRLVQWAAQLQSQVFLWECMALGPDYAETLQHDWMNDDLSTLSNTFVDHENIQGPSGMDVTRALTSFVPENSELFTAEDMMLTVIKDTARDRHTRLHPLDWRESDLIGDDVLIQFPYTVHPRNLGLVLKLARHLGIDTHLALREIINHIIPDLGSFKCYTTRFRTRFLEFWNGMSANDRVSTIGNFQTAGFYDLKPGDRTWCVTVVNNRDDRIIRSREFAEIIVNDTPANLHVLIGTNLTGLYGYLMDAIRGFVLRKNLVASTPETSRVRHSFESLQHDALVMFKRLKPDGFDLAHIRSKLVIMTNRNVSESTLSGILDELVASRITDPRPIQDRFIRADCETVYLEDIAFQVSKDLKDFILISDFFDFLKIEIDRSAHGESSIGAINDRFRQVLVNLFRNRIHILPNPFLSGDQIVDQVTHCLPPYYSIKLMGVQNIKGTGLDFAYRWVSLDKVKEAIGALDHESDVIRNKAMDLLCDYKDYGILDAPLALEALKEFRKNSARIPPDAIPQLDEAISRIQRGLEAGIAALNAGSRQGGWRRRLLWCIEQLREAGDSKRRKRKFLQIMNDLFHQRISHPRAALELQKLKKRQEGGWMIRR